MSFECACGKKYTLQTSLSRHKRTCVYAKEKFANVCQCGDKFNTQRGLSKHQKACDVLLESNKANEISIKYDMLVKVLKDKDQQMRDSRRKIKEQDGRIRELEMLLDRERELYRDTVQQESKFKQRIYEDEKEERKKTISTAGNLVGKSLSTIEYVTKHMNNAPVLKPIKDMSVIQKAEGDGKFGVADIITYHGKKKTLHKFLGNIIISHYKNADNPEQQSLWASDVSRLSYVVRQNSGKDDVWMEDKNGLKVNETIIIPLLEHVAAALRAKIQEEQDDGHEPTVEYVNRLSEVCNTLGNVGDLDRDKSISKLAQRINRYIASHFCLKKIA